MYLYTNLFWLLQWKSQAKSIHFCIIYKNMVCMFLPFSNFGTIAWKVGLIEFQLIVFQIYLGQVKLFKFEVTYNILAHTDGFTCSLCLHMRNPVTHPPIIMSEKPSSLIPLVEGQIQKDMSEPWHNSILSFCLNCKYDIGG